MLLSEKETRALCQTMLTCVKAEDAEVSITSEDFSHLRFAANAFTTSGRREDVSATVTVWVEKKRGSATVGNLDHSSLRAAVEQAEEIARLSPEDQEYLPTLPAQHYKPSEGYVEGTLHFSLAERARAIENIVRACEKAGVIGAGFHQTSGQTAGFATKHGNFFYRRASLAALSVTARTPDGGSSGYFLRNHFDVAKLDALRIGREAIHKALTARNPRVLEPGIYPVILEAQAAGDLLHFDFDARSADEGRSAYSAVGGKTRLGQQVFDPRVSICSDPWHSEVPASSAAPEGSPAEKIYFIRNGILENLQYSRYWASQKGKPPTPGPVNAIFESYATPVSIEEMIGTMPRGLLVSRFWYIRKVDPRTELFTGLTRDGLWYVENGKIQYPVRNFRFNQSLLELLAPGNVHLVGKPERISGSESQGRSAVLVPPLKVKAFHFTSPSDAI
jgi:predicted Zn-dependent protease